jgi:hypothetical protein
VVVHFDPADSAKLAAFRSAYGIDASVRIVGPYLGTLADLGENVRLVRPDAPPPEEPTFTPYVFVDEVNYGSASPWPAGAGAGSGLSLSRASRAVYGDDPANWSASAPTAGSVPFGHAYFQGGGSYSYAASTTLDSLAIEAGTTVNLTAGGGKVLRTSGLAIDPAGKLDLNDGFLIVDATAGTGNAVLAQVSDAVRSGYNPLAGQHWTGNGITSTAARNAAASVGLGVILNDGGLGTFGGQTVTADSILVRYTLLGDTTLDAKVDFNDLVKLAQNYNTSGGGIVWSGGDFNYDGSVNFSDLVTMAQAYNTSLAPAGAVITLAAGTMPWPVMGSVTATPVVAPVSTPVFSTKPIAPAPVKPVGVKKPAAVVKAAPAKPAAANPPAAFGTSKVVEKKRGVRELLTK